jgi:hypothetical protein
MALEEYKRKRDFEKTPEPPPEKPVSREGFSYLIQKHDATRLHYDLRLELDGVLLSWAVTKGPASIRPISAKPCAPKIIRCRTEHSRAQSLATFRRKNEDRGGAMC